MMDVVTGILLLLGGFFALAAGIGILRLPDVFMRMHASTKAGTLGCGLVLAAAGFHFGTTSFTAQAVLTFLFLLLTAPIAAHMIGRAALRMGVPMYTRAPDGETRTRARDDDTGD